MSRDCVMIMAGGTGGHVFPALAIAEQLRSQGVEVIWVGTRHGLEADVVPRAGFPIEWIRMSGVRASGVGRWLLMPVNLLLALFKSLLIIMRHRPQAILGMSGYVAAPGGVMACLLRKPLLIHEQNAVAGLTNRLLAWCATRVLEAFPGTFPARKHALHTGNPVRREIVDLPSPGERMAGREGPVRLLILGGSQGARVLNEVVPEALAGLAPDALDVWHQSGTNNLEVTRRHYRERSVEARVEAFIGNMAEAYGWADLVVCRAGALTIAELAAAGVGSVLVPFPQAVDDHQTHNAAFLVNRGAARLLPQDALDARSLGSLLRDFMANRPLLQEMAGAARQLAKPQATRDVAMQCLEVAR